MERGRFEGMHRDEICTVNPILEELAREGRIKMTVGKQGAQSRIWGLRRYYENSENIPEETKINYRESDIPIERDIPNGSNKQIGEQPK
jgi:hypothetical protein